MSGHTPKPWVELAGADREAYRSLHLEFKAVEAENTRLREAIGFERENCICKVREPCPRCRRLYAALEAKS